SFRKSFHLREEGEGMSLTPLREADLLSLTDQTPKVAQVHLHSVRCWELGYSPIDAAVHIIYLSSSFSFFFLSGVVYSLTSKLSPIFGTGKCYISIVESQ